MARKPNRTRSESRGMENKGVKSKIRWTGQQTIKIILKQSRCNLANWQEIAVHRYYRVFDLKTPIKNAHIGASWKDLWNSMARKPNRTRSESRGMENKGVKSKIRWTGQQTIKIILKQSRCNLANWQEIAVHRYYRVFDLKTPIKNAHCWAQGVPRVKGRVFPCSLIAPIFCVKISAF